MTSTICRVGTISSSSTYFISFWELLLKSIDIQTIVETAYGYRNETCTIYPERNTEIQTLTLKKLCQDCYVQVVE